MIFSNCSFVFILFVSYFVLNVICLSGCAISGCGNPVSTGSSTNSLENSHTKGIVKHNHPECKSPTKKYQINRATIKGKYYSHI
jgi:hypothetical protein